MANLPVCYNSVQPLLLPWLNNTVSADGNAQVRGVSLGIGSPIQPLSLKLSITSPDTFIHNVAACSPGGASNTSCVAQLGGIFDATKSHTYQLDTLSTWNGSYFDGLNSEPFIYFTDDVAVARDQVVYGYPMLMNSNGVVNTGGLAMGPNSSFLNAVIAGKLAPIDTYGFWAGSRSIDSPADGLVVIGGYDPSQFTEDLTDFPLLVSQPIVEVTGLVWQPEGGASTSLITNSSATFTIAIDPFDTDLAFPADVFQAFLTATDAINDPIDGVIYPIAKSPKGNLTVTLTGGYTTVIQTEELFGMFRGYDANGKYIITNNTFTTARVENYTGDAFPVFGMPYLTYNYMIVNHNQSTFQLAPIIPGTTPSQDSVKMLCSPVAPVPPMSSSTTTPTASPSPNPNPHHKAPIGAIVGGVVGGLAVLAIIALVAVLFMRRKKTDKTNPEAAPGHQQHNMVSSEPMAYGDKGTGVNAPPAYHPAEMTMAEKQRISELPSQYGSPVQGGMAYGGMSPHQGGLSPNHTGNEWHGSNHSELVASPLSTSSQPARALHEDVHEFDAMDQVHHVSHFDSSK